MSEIIILQGDELRKIIREELEAFERRKQPKPPPNDDLDLISRKELIKKLDISAPTFSVWLKEGKLPIPKRVGRRIYFSRHELSSKMKKAGINMSRKQKKKK